MPHQTHTNDTRPLPEVRGYRLLRVIHHGAMSSVYLAEQVALSREVAIKVMAPHALSDEVSRRRFETEVRTIARLEHPHVVRIHELGRTGDGLPYYTMPHLARGHLGQRSFQRGGDGPDETRVISILRALLEALRYAHGRGVVHRDVKAENVLFDDTEQPLLADFGIALRRGFGPRVTATGLAVGSTAYMAPEQARGEDVDGRADLYSLGVLAWEMLVGDLPYQAADALSMAVMHAQQPIPRLPPHLRHWQRFMNRALAKQPNQRFADTAQMSAMLDRVERRQDRSLLTAGWTRALDSLSGLPRAAWIGAVVLLVALAALLLIPTQRPDEGAADNDAIAATETGHHDPIAAMLQPLPEAPLQIALDNARRQIAQNRLTTPEDDNARASVLRAWEAEPDNPEVHAVLDSLVDAMAAPLLASLRQGRDQQAREEARRIRQLASQTGTLDSTSQRRLREAVVKALQERIANASNPSDRPAAAAIAELAASMGLPEDTTRRLQALAAAPVASDAPATAGTTASAPSSSLRPVSRDEYALFATATGRKPALCRERASLLRVLARRDWRTPGFEQTGSEPVVCVSMVDAQAYAHWLSQQGEQTYRLPSVAESGTGVAGGNGREISLWQLDCGDGCKERKVRGGSWRNKDQQRVLDAGRGYDDVGFRLIRGS